MPAFTSPLVRGTLVRRYKRFLADVLLDDGTPVTAHCPNSGSMLGIAPPGAPVWLSRKTAATAKLAWGWELVEIDGVLVGINTQLPNLIAAEAIAAGLVPSLAGYPVIRREVKVGVDSRIDLVLEAPDRPRCLVEIKNVTLFREGAGDFPDAVTARGAKHLRLLSERVEAGERAVQLYIVQRGDCDRMRVAADIDPVYDRSLRQAVAAGVEAMALGCQVRPDGVWVDRALPLALNEAIGSRV